MENTTKSKKKNSDNPEDPPRVIKTPADLQRLRLEKLMKNPDKPVLIPETPKERNMPNAPDFVRNVMGSSAGAGSGEFHVYRHLRRKEYARQKFIQERSHKEILDAAYHEKLEKNKRDAEEKTAKKRQKRLKKKNAKKARGKQPKLQNDNDKTSESENESEEDVKKDNMNEGDNADIDDKKIDVNTQSNDEDKEENVQKEEDQNDI